MESLRQRQQHDFLHTALNSQPCDITVLPGDASFRRYFRIVTAEHRYLLMDAPPSLEDCHGFVAVAEQFRAAGVLTPRIYAQDLKLGFLLLEDFGDALLSQSLSIDRVTDLYQACFEPLLKIQQVPVIDTWPLTRFDQHLAHVELNNCREWFIEKFLSVPIDAELDQCLTETFALLLTDLQRHPQVCVHRDYHSRNLMLLPKHQIGVLDFQDAVTGSITYDLVSLLRDCYVAWPKEQVHAWVAIFYWQLPCPVEFSLRQFQQWFDWQGMQRHLKCLFIFARKWLRDGSKNYLADLITTFAYIEDVANDYPEFTAFASYLPIWRVKMLAIITETLKA